MIKYNVLNDKVFQEVLGAISINDFPWFYDHNTSILASERRFNNLTVMDYGQHFHMFVRNGEQNSSWFPVIKPLLKYCQEEFGLSQLIRAKANLMVRQHTYPIEAVNTPHYDTQESGTTVLYYLNTVSDGQTIFFEETYEDDPNSLSVMTTVTPVANSAVVFPSNQYHASSNTTEDHRMVINLVFGETYDCND
jgi:hypothetical protein